MKVALIELRQFLSWWRYFFQKDIFIAAYATLWHTPMMTNQRKIYTDEKSLDVGRFSSRRRNCALDEEEKPQVAVDENPYLSRFY